MKSGKIANIFTTIILLLICIALAAAIIIKMFQPKEAISFERMQKEPSVSSSNVYVKEVFPETFVKTLKFYGKAKDDSDTLGIISRTSGYVSEILVSENDQVKEGQIIGYVDPSSPGATYKKAAITAKVDGIIDSIETTVGSYITTGTVFAIEKEEPKYVVKMSLPEKYIDNIHIGSTALLSSSIRSELDTKATVTEISKTIDSASRTVEITPEPEDSSLFLDGPAFTIKLVIDQVDDAIVVPSDSISSIGDKSFVFVVNDGIAYQKEVEIGASNDDETVIVSGLSSGDSVVVEGTVAEGASVNIVER